MNDTTQSIARRRLSKTQRRDQLLDCAVTAYARSGVERAGHSEVAKLAGVSTPTVFNYFPTREALTDAVFNVVRSKFLTFIQDVPKEGASSGDQIHTITETYGNLSEYESNIVKVYLNWSVAFGPETRAQFLGFQDEILSTITKRLGGSQEDRSVARLILAASSAFILMKLDNTDATTIQRFVDRVVNALT